MSVFWIKLFLFKWKMFINIWQTSSVQCKCWTLAVCEVSQVLRMSSPPPWTHPASALIVLEKNCCRQKVPTLTFCQKPFSAVRQRQQRLLGLNSSAEGDFYLLYPVNPPSHLVTHPPLPPSQGPPLPPHLELLNFCCISRSSCSWVLFLLVIQLNVCLFSSYAHQVFILMKGYPVRHKIWCTFTITHISWFIP